MIQVVVWHDVMQTGYQNAKFGAFDGLDWASLFKARRRVYSRYAPAVHATLTPLRQARA